MATVEKEIEICDICGNETDGFYYWENTTSPFGVIGENWLIIDICEHCARKIRFKIPENMMQERYGSETASKKEIEENIRKWRAEILD